MSYFSNPQFVSAHKTRPIDHETFRMWKVRAGIRDGIDNGHAALPDNARWAESFGEWVTPNVTPMAPR